MQTRTKPCPKGSAEYTARFLQGKNTGFLSFDIIRNLKNTTSCGVDGINTQVLKRFCNLLSPLIAHVINLILTQSKWPKLWKMGIVSPVPKKNDLSQPSNWRPVVPNNAMSKIAECIINHQLVEHLDPVDSYLTPSTPTGPRSHVDLHG